VCYISEGADPGAGGGGGGGGGGVRWVRTNPLRDIDALKKSNLMAFTVHRPLRLRKHILDTL